MKIIAVIYATFVVAKRKLEKKNKNKNKKKESGFYGIRTLDHCDTGAALYQFKLTSQLGAGR